MSALSALYPSATGGSGVVLSPLSVPAPEAEPLQAAEPTADAVAPTEARSPAGDPPAQPEGQPALDDAALVEHGDKPAGGDENEADAPPVDMTLDERPNFFKDARLEEIPAHTTTDFNAVVRSPADTEMDMTIVGDGLRAAVKMGLGITTMQCIWKAAVDASRSPIRTSPEAGLAALTAEFGDATVAKLASANAWISQAEQTWPEIRLWLRASGLGSDPGFIKFVVRAAERRGL